MMMLIRLSLVALALGVSAGIASAAAGPMKESMETMKKAWKDAAAVDQEVKRVQASLAEAGDAQKKAILDEEIAAAEAALRSVEDESARVPGDADLKASAANLRAYLEILRSTYAELLSSN